MNDEQLREVVAQAMSEEFGLLRDEMTKLRHDIAVLEDLVFDASLAPRCPLPYQEEGGVFHLVVEPGERREALKHLKGFTKDSEKLVIVDPYFFGGDTAGSDKFASEVVEVARLRNLNRLHVIYSSAHGNTLARQRAIKDACSDEQVHYTTHDTPDVHDRVWIADRARAVVVGNSIGGLGRERASFILPLPGEDLYNLLAFLDKRGFMRRN